MGNFSHTIPELFQVPKLSHFHVLLRVVLEFRMEWLTNLRILYGGWLIWSNAMHRSILVGNIRFWDNLLIYDKIYGAPKGFNLNSKMPEISSEQLKFCLHNTIKHVCKFGLCSMIKIKGHFLKLNDGRLKIEGCIDYSKTFSLSNMLKISVGM